MSLQENTTWPLNLLHYGSTIVECLLRSDSQCKTAQRAELSPLPASFLPGQTERKPSSSWNKARKLRAKCWMDEPHRSKRHCSGVIYVDADTKYNVHIDALPHKTGLWRCFGGLVGIVTQVFFQKNAKRKHKRLHLACHISSLAMRSHEEGWNLFTKRTKIRGKKKL